MDLPATTRIGEDRANQHGVNGRFESNLRLRGRPARHAGPNGLRRDIRASEIQSDDAGLQINEEYWNSVVRLNFFPKKMPAKWTIRDFILAPEFSELLESETITLFYSCAIKPAGIRNPVPRVTGKPGGKRRCQPTD